MPSGTSVGDHEHMPAVVTSRPSSSGLSAAAALRGTVVGLILVVGGLTLGVVTFETGFVDHFMVARPSAIQMAMGAVAWTFALTAPALFLVVGLARLVEIADRALGGRGRLRPASRHAASLPSDHVIATRVRLPDGRILPELVVGPFGIAVIEELPPVEAARRHGDRWEVRVSTGGWMPIENPLERAARDAERVRRWVAHEDHDHVVKVYAAVVATDPSVERTPTCAVVRPDHVPAWLAALPAQRSLNADRRAWIAELITGAMA